MSYGSSVAGEIVSGKRTFIARAEGEGFELPEGHQVNVVHGEDGEVVGATLRWGDHNSTYFATMDEGDDRVTLRLGMYFGSVGVGSSGDALGQILPYQFPD